MTMYLNAESVTVDSDEGQLTLEVFGYGGPDQDEVTLRVNIHGIDLDAFYNQVKARIGPYLQERDEVQRAFVGGYEYVNGERIFACNPDESGGYALDDPKHETYHERMSEVWDNREGK